MTEEQRAEMESCMDDVSSGLITPEPIPLELPPDTRTEEEKQADHDAFIEDLTRHMTKAIEDPDSPCSAVV